MIYHEENGQHWYVSENEHCPGIMIDKTGEHPLYNIAGNHIHDLTEQDWLDFLKLWCAVQFHQIEQMTADEIKHIKSVSQQQDRIYSAFYDSVIQSKSVTDK